SSGPTSAGVIKVKIGATKNGRIVAGECEVALQAGAFEGSPVGPACMTPFAMYDLSDVTIWGYDVVSNRPKVAAYRAPGAPISTFGVESAVDELARELKMDPVELRLINAAKDGTKAAYGPTLKDIGYIETLDAAKASAQWTSDLGEAPKGKKRGRGIASGFWFNIGGESSGATYVNEDGTVTVVSGNPDVGGSRASMAMMAAEVLGIGVERVRPIVGDTASVGYSFLTGGSRVTFATGMAVTQAAEQARDELCKRASLLWEIDAEAVEWRDGMAHPAGENAGKFDPMSLADIAAKSGRTGGPVTGKASINAQGAGPGYATHICDVEV
ncbi:MAG: xanthine dehydrogenase family protein molybdopterin-binding subunit, partial [Alphaproteobacteria bacterium]